MKATIVMAVYAGLLAAASEAVNPVKTSAISLGWDHTLVLKGDRTVAVWGANHWGQLRVPAGLSDVSAIASGPDTCLALKSDGTVVVWGNRNDFHWLTAGSNWVAVAAGWRHGVGLYANGTVDTVGLNNYGQRTVPAGLSNVTAIAAGSYHTVALKANGTVVAWGDNTYGQRTVPTGLSNVTAIAAGANFTAALKSDGTVMTWGSFSTVPGLSGVKSISGGGMHVLGLKSDGTVAAWGQATSYGQMNVPTGLSNVIAVSAYINHSAALKADGTIVLWGNDEYGQSTVPHAGAIRFAASAYAAPEGAPLQVKVKRVGGKFGKVTVQYATKQNSALAMQDYGTKSGTLTWTNGETATKVISIDILADGKREGSEIFSVLLKNPVGTTLAVPAKATVTIPAH